MSDAPAPRTSAQPVTELDRGRRIAIAIGAPVYRLWSSTLRIRWHVDEAARELIEREEPVIYAIWHETLLPTLWTHRQLGLVVLTSRHRDGELVARTVKKFGFEAIRGSSTRGGSVSLRRLVELAEEGRSLAITPDGPKGPRREVKPGVVEIARRTGCPIIPGTLRFRPQHRFATWDRMLMPAPFAGGVVLVGEPLRVAADCDVEAESARVKAALDAQVTRVEDDYAELRRGGTRRTPYRGHRRRDCRGPPRPR